MRAYLAADARSASGIRPEVDELTLRRAQQGEPDALAMVVERYHPAIHALVWRMTGGRDAHHVDDLVQDCHVRVLRGLPGFDPCGPARLTTWVLTIATRVVLNARRRAAPEPLATEPLAPAATEPPVAIERARLAVAIADAVAALPDAQRAVFVLREYHELDYAEIARALEIDLGTVKSRLARARHAVRQRLGGWT